MADNNITKQEGNGRRTNLQIIEDKRKELSEALLANKHMLSVIPAAKQERFSKNFLELATQDYLLNTIETKEIIRFAVNVSQLGLDIAPSSQEVYIIPFDTKVNNAKVMLPQSIIPLNGMQQLAYAKQFFLELDAVYQFDDGTDGAASQLTRKQQAQLQTANKKWVDEHFIGYDVRLTDLKKELPVQVKFVDKSYLVEATKTIKDERWQLQTWSHKAVRRAYKEFMIPRDRSIETFEKLEALNDSVLEKADKMMMTTFLTEEIENAVKQLGLTIKKDNGMAQVTGPNLFNHSKILKDLGFAYENNVWIMPYQDSVIDVETTSHSTPQTNVSYKIFTLNDLQDAIQELGGILSEPTVGKSGGFWVKAEVELDQGGLVTKALVDLGFKNSKGSFVREVSDLLPKTQINEQKSLLDEADNVF